MGGNVNRKKKKNNKNRVLSVTKRFVRFARADEQKRSHLQWSGAVVRGDLYANLFWKKKKKRSKDARGSDGVIIFSLRPFREKLLPSPATVFATGGPNGHPIAVSQLCALHVCGGVEDNKKTENQILATYTDAHYATSHNREEWNPWVYPTIEGASVLAHFRMYPGRLTGRGRPRCPCL